MSRGEFLRSARRAGWRATITPGGHVRLDHSDALGPVYTASTPSDRRWSRNARAEMRRALRRAAAGGDTSPASPQKP